MKPLEDMVAPLYPTIVPSKIRGLSGAAARRTVLNQIAIDIGESKSVRVEDIGAHQLFAIIDAGDP
jgi:hypothetical protein